MSKSLQMGASAVKDLVTEGFAVVTVLVALVWVAPPGLILPVTLVATGIYLRRSGRRRQVGTYVLWAGVALAILAAVITYGLNGHTTGKVLAPVHAASRP